MQMMNFIAEASKPKLYHWTGLADASEDWTAYQIKLDALLTSAGCKSVSNRVLQLPLLVPIPVEPQPPAPIAAAVPTPMEYTAFNYEVANYKLYRDVYDRIVKVHKDAEENAEKAFNKWPELHTTDSKFLTGVLRIQTESRQAAWQIGADLASFGLTYLTAQDLITQDDAADAAAIALLIPIVNQYPAVINAATNVSILYAAQDWVEREFAPGKVEQRSFYQEKFDNLRDYDEHQGAGECIRKFTETLRWLEKSGGALPIQTIEQAVARTFTGKEYQVWIKDMGMETLRLTPIADRKHSWQDVIKDIERLVTRHPELDQFRSNNKKRSAAQAGYAGSSTGITDSDRRRAAEEAASRNRKRNPAQPWHPATRGGGVGNRDRRAHAIELEISEQDRRDKAWEDWMESRNKRVRFASDHYGPGVEKGLRDPGEAGHCWRCWGTDHFAADCTSNRCNKCTAPIRGGTVHNARICNAPRQPGAGRGRGRGDARAGRGSPGGRGGRGN